MRIGVDNLTGAAVGEIHTLAGSTRLRTHRVADFTDLAEVIDGHNPTVLDVRQLREYDDGHTRGAVNIPLHELSKRIGEVLSGEV